MKSNFICLRFINIFPIRVKISWNIGDNRNLFLKLKSKLELYHVVLTTPKTCHQKLTFTVVEMQQFPHIEKTNFKDEISCLKKTIYNGKRKVCVNFQTDTDKLNIVVYRYRNNLYFKDNEVDLKMTNTSHFWQYQFIFWALLTCSTSSALFWMKQLFIISTNSDKNGCSFPHEHLPIVLGIKKVIWGQVFAKTCF